ncbi:MAG: TatD family hydrolase [Alphaproteobacteria bacterium]|nr:MAG: hypothetical protein B6I23_02175 [Rickettsiaceae bacterium 4572_127]
MLIDSHCHLNDERLLPNLDEILVRAKAKNVSGFLAIGCKLEDFEIVLKIAEKYHNFWASLGIHPAEADEQNPSYETLLPFYNNQNVIGIGECGFDFYYADKKRDFKRQKELFLTQIHLAQKFQKPLIIHTRDAEKETQEILESEYKNKPFQAIMHCYTGTWDLARKMLDLGFYFSASGVITFKKANELREIFSKIPTDRLLVETDAPYLSPEPYRGKICEPSFVFETAKKLAEIKKTSFENMANKTTKNFKKLFSLH